MAQQVTDAQIERIEIAILQLAQRGNAWGLGLEKQIVGKGKDEKRRLILGAYGQMYEAMLCVQMAMTSTRTPEQVKAELAQSGGQHGRH